LAFSVTAVGTAKVLAHPCVLVVAVVVVVTIVVILVVVGLLITLITGLTVLFLLLIDILGSCLEVSFQINNVLSIIVGTTAALVVRAETENNESLRYEELTILTTAFFTLTGKFLNELTLLKFDGVVGQIDLTIVLEVTTASTSGSTKGLGTTHKAG
jgi:hypothetical protein